MTSKTKSSLIFSRNHQARLQRTGLAWHQMIRCTALTAAFSRLVFHQNHFWCNRLNHNMRLFRPATSTPSTRQSDKLHNSAVDNICPLKDHWNRWANQAAGQTCSERKKCQKPSGASGSYAKRLVLSDQTSVAFTIQQRTPRVPHMKRMELTELAAQTPKSGPLKTEPTMKMHKKLTNSQDSVSCNRSEQKSWWIRSSLV